MNNLKVYQQKVFINEIYGKYQRNQSFTDEMVRIRTEIQRLQNDIETISYGTNVDGYALNTPPKRVRDIINAMNNRIHILQSKLHETKTRQELFQKAAFADFLPENEWLAHVDTSSHDKVIHLIKICNQKISQALHNISDCFQPDQFFLYIKYNQDIADINARRNKLLLQELH